jgi:nicotinate phosphoribosyltransferase
MRGYRQVKLFVSGGLDEEDIVNLNPLVDGYGLGTSISNARVVDFSMDIVEIDGKPLAKRGKASGSKRVVRCRRCLEDVVLPGSDKFRRCHCGGNVVDLLLPMIAKGKVKGKLPSPIQIREKVVETLRGYEL